jgi:methyl-accepting chemotaxis protein
VAKIVKDIDEIAFQTNILALNAAVEAARAGQAGLGFAVVADEVRNLAQRSAVSAKETASRIEIALQKSHRGVEISARVAAGFGQIADKTREVNTLVAEIATASREQAQGIEQINTAVSQMDKVTQNTAASAEESASAAEELNAQAAALKESVSHLQQLVGGKSAAREPAPMPEVPSTDAARHNGSNHLPPTTTPATAHPENNRAKEQAPRHRRGSELEPAAVKRDGDDGFHAF